MSTKSGTRVFKKSSLSGKITTYVGKRDFIDHLTHIDTIDGMVYVDKTVIEQGHKVVVSLCASFCYGREDLDVLGLQLRKDLLLQKMVVYPVDSTLSCSHALTNLQQRLRHKLGDGAYPFWFNLQSCKASSVTLQPTLDDCGKPCGVDYELKAYIVENGDDCKPKKHNCVRLAIRKLTCIPLSYNKTQPFFEISKDFMMSTGLLHIEASLDKALYYHGENIFVNVYMQNNSSKTVKKIKIVVYQKAEICLFSTASYQCDVAKFESTEGFPINTGGNLTKVYSVCPVLANKRGLALDGKLKHEDTNLASSTVVLEKSSREEYGIIVEYKVKLRFSLGGPLGGEICGELPFLLTRPDVDESEVEKENADTQRPVEVDLIQLDTSDVDDIVFEDFARLRVRVTTLQAVDSEQGSN